jgi:CubicO group peptidase (beta-lactamase class C family)
MEETMKKLILLLCIIILLPTMGLSESLDDKFAYTLSKYNTTGAAIVIMRGGKIEYEYYYGRQGRKSEKVTENTHFHNASVAKMITALGVMKLYDEGKIELDKNISEYFNFPVGNPKYKDVPVTIRQVMSHTSSISGKSKYASRKHDLEWLLTPDRDSNSQWRNWAPGTKYEYANLNGGLLGSIIECISGMSVDDYMKKEFFEPLNIDAAYSTTLLNDKENISWKFNAKGEIVENARQMLKRNESYEDTCDYKNSYYKTVGGLRVRAKDLARLTYILCKDGSVDGIEFLKPETVKLMRTNQGEIVNSSVTTSDSNYGLNVDISLNDMTPVKWYGHQGTLGTFVCNAYFNPELDSVVVLLTNGCNMKKNNYVCNISRAVMDVAYEYLTEGQ